MSYTEQVLHQTKKTQKKKKIILALVKQQSSSDMRTIKNIQ